MNRKFVHLRLKTEYSILSSNLRLKDVDDFLKNNSNSVGIGLMDDNSLSASFQFSKTVIKNNVKPIFGINIFLSQNESSNMESDVCSIGLIAKNHNGYKNLLKLLSFINKKKQYSSYIGNNLATLNDIKNCSEDLICITGANHNSFLYKNFTNNVQNDFLLDLNSIFKDNLYIEISRNGKKNEFEVESKIISLAYELNLPLVATNDVRFYKPHHFESYDILTCVKSNKIVYDKNRLILNSTYCLKSEQDMIDLFSDIPEAIDNTIEIYNRCSFLIEKSNPKLPKYKTLDDGKSIDNEKDLILLKSSQRFNFLIKDLSDEESEVYKKRFDYEVSVIENMNYLGYFLVVGDFVNWAKSQNISVGPGRGSGVGSLVAYCLGITNLDPIAYGLLFERFLNPDRVSMPDFDIDFCQERRSEVINYVINKYGNDYVGYIVTFGKLNAKAVLKDVGRALGMPYFVVDQISKLIPFNPLEQITIEKAIEMDPKLNEERNSDPDIAQLIDISLDLEGLIRHKSTHAAGIIISNLILSEYAPIDYDDNGMPVVSYSMKDAEDIGLVKFDFLGLKTLTLISKTVNLIKKEKDISVNIDDIDVRDEGTFELLRTGMLIGIFQLEASIPRFAIIDSKADRIEDIMAITSLNRPGPMSNIPIYISRKKGEESVSYYHESLREVLKETFGIIIYQEQVIKIAQVIAGYTLAQADLLRRAMGKKVKEEMDLQKNFFIDGAKKNKIDTKKAEELFNLIEKFAGYGFNKSHAAAYSMISYQTAYLKKHYSIEFFVSLLNIDLDDPQKISIIINEVKHSGIEINPPDVNESQALFSIKEGAIQYGLSALKLVGYDSAKAIEKERNENGKFIDIFDFLDRLDRKYSNKKILESLIKSGSFDSVSKTFNRSSLVDSVIDLLKYADSSNEASLEFSLFDSSEIEKAKPKINHIEQSAKDLNLFELESFGFYLTTHPLINYPDIIYNKNLFFKDDFDAEIDKQKGSFAISVSGVIVKIVQRFKKGGRFAFINIMDTQGIFETMIFDDKLLTQKREILQESKCIVARMEVSFDPKTSGNRIMIRDVEDIDNVLHNQNIIRPIEYKAEKKNTFYKNKKTINNDNKIQKDVIINDKDLKVFVRLKKHNKSYIINLLKNFKPSAQDILYSVVLITDNAYVDINVQINLKTINDIEKTFV